MLLLRSLLFTPGIRPRMIEKAPSVPADLICLDLEDSVPPAEKPNARRLVGEYLPRLPRTGYMLLVRVNGLESGLLEEDLAAVVGPELEGISLPKTHRPEIVQQVDHYLTLLEKSRGLPQGQIKIIPWIETAEGVAKAYQICTASPRLIGASFGGEDFATDMAVQRTKASKEIEYGRFAVATACKAAKILPIDTPEPDYRDLEHLRTDSLFARSIGYRGKYCIHPDQVPIVNEVFEPTEEEVQRAQVVARAYEAAEAQGLGAISLEGYMIDRPIYLRARRLLEWAQASGAQKRMAETG